MIDIRNRTNNTSSSNNFIVKGFSITTYQIEILKTLFAIMSKYAEVTTTTTTTTDKVYIL